MSQNCQKRMPHGFRECASTTDELRSARERSIKMRSIVDQPRKMFHLTSALATAAVLALTLAMATPVHAITATCIDRLFGSEPVNHAQIRRATMAAAIVATAIYAKRTIVAAKDDSRATS